MTEQNSANDIQEVKNLKKQLVISRLKLSQGEQVSINEYRANKKKIARILTKLNRPKK